MGKWHRITDEELKRMKAQGWNGPGDYRQEGDRLVKIVPPREETLEGFVENWNRMSTTAPFLYEPVTRKIPRRNISTFESRSFWFVEWTVRKFLCEILQTIANRYQGVGKARYSEIVSTVRELELNRDADLALIDPLAITLMEYATSAYAGALAAQKKSLPDEKKELMRELAEWAVKVLPRARSTGESLNLLIQGVERAFRAYWILVATTIFERGGDISAVKQEIASVFLPVKPIVAQSLDSLIDKICDPDSWMEYHRN